MSKDVDYIIVGFGLSGLAICEHLLQNNQTVVVIDQQQQSASKVAGGMYNPVILKRFTLAWDAKEQLDYSMSFYKKIENKLDHTVLNPIPVYRRFHSIGEQNNWFSAVDKPGLDSFLNTEIRTKINSHIQGQFGFGEVLHTGTIDTKHLLNSYWTHLSKKYQTQNSSFIYEDLNINENAISYQNIKAKGIIFCEGFAVKHNPHFNFIDIRENKGEYIIIEAEDLNLEVAVKSNIFIIPLGNNTYKVGASYDRDDTSLNPTKAKREQLEKQLQDLISTDYKVIDQVAGIRPTTKDRKPYIGHHPTYKKLFICNGLGSRGVMTSPTIAKHLVENILNGTKIPFEIDLKRHYK